MDGGSNDVELLLASANQEINALRGDPRFSEPKEGTRGAALWRHVLDLIEASELRMGRVPDASAGASAREAFARGLRESIFLLRAAHRSIPWLVATKAPNVNLGSLHLSEECAEILVGSDVDLVVLPDVEFMYSTVSWPFAKVIEGTRGFQPKTKSRPIILNYPLSDSDRLLLHPLFAHELGHASIDKFKFIPRLKQTLIEDSDFAVDLAATVTSLRQGRWTASSESKIRRTLLAWLEEWLEEILCDHLAVEASGPAYLWAFSAFLLPQNYSEPSPTHPPSMLRIRLLLDQLEANDWRTFTNTAAPGVMSWLDEVGADVSKPMPEPYAFLCRQLLRHGDLLRQAATGRVGGDGLRPGDTVDQAQQAASLLRRLILPVGPKEDPFAPRAILLGGWLEGLRQHEDSPKGVIKALAHRRLQNLIGKGIEMSTVAAAWAER